MNKRDIALGLIAGLAGAAIVPAAANAGAAATEGDARQAILAWLGALASHDPAAVAKVLAPEFQILRSDGSGYDSQGYLKNLPKFRGKPDISKLAFSSHGELLVTRYMLKLEQKIGDKEVQTLAPRLSVFSRSGAGWLIVAHANFAQIG